MQNVSPSSFNWIWARRVLICLQADASLQLWCTELTLIRYLRARNWDVNKASQMLQKTLDWCVETAFLEEITLICKEAHITATAA